MPTPSSACGIGAAVNEDPWSAATFDGAMAAQAAAVADLTPAERLEVLESLLELATASGALRRSRAEKQRALDAQWGG